MYTKYFGENMLRLLLMTILKTDYVLSKKDLYIYLQNFVFKLQCRVKMANLKLIEKNILIFPFFPIYNIRDEMIFWIKRNYLPVQIFFESQTVFAQKAVIPRASS